MSAIAQYSPAKNLIINAANFLMAEIKTRLSEIKHVRRIDEKM